MSNVSQGYPAPSEDDDSMAVFDRRSSAAEPVRRSSALVIASAVATVIGVIAASMATSGQVSPLGVSIASSVAAGATALVAFLAQQK